jgi:hypothetical protein
MDNELIMIIGENMIMGPKLFKFFCLKNHFHEQCLTIQKILLWNECHPPPPPRPVVVNKIIYLLCEKLEHLENK